MRIALGCDDAARKMAEVITKSLTDKGIDVDNFMPDHDSGENDYPYIAERAAAAVVSGICDLAILICGTGVGVSIAANKVNGIRAACCNEVYTARMAKEHNDANILCFGARVIGPEVAEMIVDAWLSADFKGERHAGRIKVFNDIEKKNNR
jgi:ribose 5-phosphate isomerase B